MKGKKIIKALLAVCSLATIAFAAGCGAPVDSSSGPDQSSHSSTPSESTSPPDGSSSSSPAEAVYEFEGTKDVHIAASAETYDFTAGVTATKNLEAAEFTVDSSAVRFGTPGEYAVKYKLDDYEEEIKVYIYGDPVFVSAATTLSYLDAQTETGLKKAATAKDFFGNELSVKVEEGIAPNALGYIEYGKHTVKFSATDKVGNKKEYTLEVMVSDADKPDLADIEIDLVDIEKTTRYDGLQISKIIYDGAALTSDDYSFINGYLAFSEAFVLDKEVGDYQLLVVTNGGYDEVTLSVTDKENVKYAFSLSDMSYANILGFDGAELLSHQRNISFEYLLKDSNDAEVELTATDTGYTFVPGLETSFSLTLTAKRNGTAVGTEEYPFTVQDDVYMWMVNRKNDASKTNYYFLNDGEYEAEYDGAESPDGNGSLYVENVYGEFKGVVQFYLNGVSNLAKGAKLNFYIYNPTGIKLGAYIYTNSGYWNAGMTGGTIDGVLTDQAEISEQTGWQKVTLTLLPGFDGSLGGMSNPADDKASKAELRIFNPDNWKWEGEGSFGFNISNIYVETVHGTEGISYDETKHQNTGVATLPVTLASASSTDGRHWFEYEVKKGDIPVAMSEETMSFTPAEEGTYTYTITCYWRDEKVDIQTYTIEVGGALALAVNPYYQYDINGKVALPKASCAIAGAALKYTVTNSAGDATVLGEDMAYDTKKTNGSYTYKVEAFVGGTVVATAEKVLPIHDGRVMYGSGISADGMPLMYNNTPEFTTEVAAPGELGSMKLDGNKNMLEKKELGNFNIRLDERALGKSMVVFYIKHTSKVGLSVQGFASNTWIYTNFWFNGTRYQEDSFVITGVEDGWQKVEMHLANPLGTPVEGADIRLNIITNPQEGYPWSEGDEPVIYISNIYYVDPA